MDAISFVLGISSKHLRSTHFGELVYRGRVLKHSKINAEGAATEGAQEGGTEGQEKEGEASEEEEEEEEETESQRADPTTAWVMAVYEDDAGEEQAWKRSITSRGTTEYRINNRVVTAQQYNEALEEQNILIKARNFLVFQGDVETVASQSAKALTRLIEQISGSLEYKADYERLKVEHEKAEEENVFKLQQRRGINSEIKQFQEQKREAEAYNRKADERDQAIVNHVLWKLYHFQRTIEESGAEIQRHNEELKEHRRNVESFQKKLDDAQKDQARIQREVTKIERNIKQKERNVEEKENSLVPITEKLSLTSKKIETSRKRIAEIAKERDAQSRQADSLRKQLSTVQKAQSRWEDEWRAQQQQAGRELSAEDLQDYNRLRGDVNRQTAADQIKVDNIRRQLKTDEETVNSLKSKVDSTEAQIARLSGEISELQNRRKDVNSDIKSTAKEIDTKKKEFNALTSERLRTNQKHTELDEKLREVLHKLADASSSQRESEKEARTREIVAQMKRIFPGVRGQLWTLCKPKQKRYNVAVSTVLGRHHDSIVVDTEKTAKDCIQYLRDQRAGQATFIPLDTIMHKTPDSNLKGMHKGVRLAIDTVDYETAVERAVSYACGNSIVCDDLNLAKEMVYNRRVDAKAVTLDGTVIHKAGLMTGGHGPNDQRNARKWEESEVENLRLLKDRFLNEIAALPRNHQRQAEEEALQGDLSGLEARLRYAQEELKALDRNIDSKRRELKFAQDQLAEVQPKYTEQSQGLDTQRTQLQQFVTSVERVEDTVFAAFCQRLGYPNIRAYEAQQGSAQQEASQRKLEYTTQISKLENQIAFETQRLEATQARITRLESEINDAEQMIESLEAERDSLNEELDTFRAELEQLNEQLSTQKGKLDSRSEKVAEARRELAKRSKNVDATTRAITSLEGEIQNAGSSRYQLLKRCRIEEIDIPLAEGSRKLESLPMEGVISGEEMDPERMGTDSQVSPEVQTFGIDPDFDVLEDELKEDESEEQDHKLQEIISDLQSELEKMAPNLRAVERLSTTETRLKSHDKDFEASRKAAQRARKAFDDVRKKRTDLFNRAFEHIRDQIDRVYKDLTRTASFPLGGKAFLHLENDEEPYLEGVKYHAMPPLKRFRDMEHLSGGEKTMAALALLFAIHTYAPSPFFVLDEVDAALDNANTARLANYVKENARPGMQFIVISLKVCWHEVRDSWWTQH